MGALMSYRLPPFLALNEPETSLHPSLLDPLARLITGAASRTQILVVTHSEALASAIREHSGISTRRVIKNDGATWIEGLSQIGTFVDD
jgi:predicted ATPase